MRKIFAIALLAVAPLCARKERKPKPPTQEPITEGCAYIYDIRASTDIWKTAVIAFDARVKNTCNRTSDITVTVGYFKSDQTQSGTALWHNTVASGAEMRLHIDASDHYPHSAMIIRVNTF